MPARRLPVLLLLVALLSLAAPAVAPLAAVAETSPHMALKTKKAPKKSRKSPKKKATSKSRKKATKTKAVRKKPATATTRATAQRQAAARSAAPAATTPAPVVAAAPAPAAAVKSEVASSIGTLPKGSQDPRPFAPTSIWNAAVPAGAAVDPGSAAMVARLNGVVASEQAARSGPWINSTTYSAPVYTVPAGQATVRVTLDAGDAVLSSAFAAVPLPAGAVPAAGSDHHLVVWQPSTDRMWEFWAMTRQADGWHAKWGGAMQNVSANQGVFGTDSWPGAQTWWGATASSLPLLGGLIRISELKAGEIDHALALNLPEIRKGVYALPAQRTDGGVDATDAIPEGAHLRLDPNLDLSTIAMPPMTRVLAEAAQKYGIVIRDGGGVMAFEAEDPTPLGGINPYSNAPMTAGVPAAGGFYGGQYPFALLASFPWSHLQVLKMTLKAS